MPKKLYSKFLIFFLLGLTSISAKETAKKSASGDNLKAEIKAYILHHIQDTHDFTLLSYTDEQGKKVHIGAPLPVIIWDDGLKTFSSSELTKARIVRIIRGKSSYIILGGKVFFARTMIDPQIFLRNSMSL